MKMAPVSSAAQFTIEQGSFYEIFWLFLLASVGGFILEGIWCVVRLHRWENHSGLIWGPLCTIYGVGAVAMYLISGMIPAQLPHWGIVAARFAVCALAGSAVEYFTSLLQEINFGSSSWDYSHHRANLFGRVSPSMTAVWGLIGAAFLEWLCPPMLKLIAGIDGAFGWAATWAMVWFTMANCLMSALTVKRWQRRTMGIEAANRLEQWLDRHYDDERMLRSYANMTFIKTEPTGESRPRLRLHLR